MFHTDGTIINPNAPRVGQPVGTAPYGALYIPAVTFGSLRARNQRNFNIGVVNGGLAGMAIDLACHHVVGWDVIWGFWNKLMAQQHYASARDYLALFGAPKNETAKLDSWAKNNTFVDQWNAEQQMCWKPNNIVRGPNDRSDDPNSNVGLANKIDFKRAGKHVYKGRIPPLVATGLVMVDYIGTGVEDKAKKAIKSWTTIRAEEIMEWNEDLWVVDETYPGYSNTPAVGGGFTVVRPKWKVVNGPD